MKQNVGGLVVSKHKLENSLAFQKAISAGLAASALWGLFATVTQFSLLQKLLRCTEELSGTALKTCAKDVRGKDNLYTICGLMLLTSSILFARMVYQGCKRNRE